MPYAVGEGEGEGPGGGEGKTGQGVGNEIKTGEGGGLEGREEKKGKKGKGKGKKGKGAVEGRESDPASCVGEDVSRFARGAYMYDPWANEIGYVPWVNPMTMYHYPRRYAPYLEDMEDTQDILKFALKYDNGRFCYADQRTKKSSTSVKKITKETATRITRKTDEKQKPTPRSLKKKEKTNLTLQQKKAHAMTLKDESFASENTSPDPAYTNSKDVSVGDSSTAMMNSKEGSLSEQDALVCSRKKALTPVMRSKAYVVWLHVMNHPKPPFQHSYLRDVNDETEEQELFKLVHEIPQRPDPENTLVEKPTYNLNLRQWKKSLRKLQPFIASKPQKASDDLEIKT